MIVELLQSTINNRKPRDWLECKMLIEIGALKRVKHIEQEHNDIRMTLTYRRLLYKHSKTAHDKNTFSARQADVWVDREYTVYPIYVLQTLSISTVYAEQIQHQFLHPTCGRSIPIFPTGVLSGWLAFLSFGKQVKTRTWSSLCAVLTALQLVSVGPPLHLCPPIGSLASTSPIVLHFLFLLFIILFFIIRRLFFVIPFFFLLLLFSCFILEGITVTHQYCYTTHTVFKATEDPPEEPTCSMLSSLYGSSPSSSTTSSLFCPPAMSSWAFRKWKGQQG